MALCAPRHFHSDSVLLAYYQNVGTVDWVFDHPLAPKAPRTNVSLVIAVLGFWIFLGSGPFAMVLSAPFMALTGVFCVKLIAGARTADPWTLRYYRRVLLICMISMLAISFALLFSVRAPMT